MMSFYENGEFGFFWSQPIMVCVTENLEWDAVASCKTDDQRPYIR